MAAAPLQPPPPPPPPQPPSFYRATGGSGGSARYGGGVATEPPLLSASSSSSSLPRSTTPSAGSIDIGGGGGGGGAGAGLENALPESSVRIVRRVRATVHHYRYRYSRRLQALLDRSTPHVKARWASLALLYVLFALRVYTAAGFYIVAYTLAIFNLNLLLGFLQPRDIIELQDDERIRLPTRRRRPRKSASVPARPRAAGERGADGDNGGGDGDDDDEDIEYRPFVRKLPEFQFWWRSTKSALLASGATLFRVLDVPVFWPVLVLYFLMLFGMTMKRQILHMRQYGYVPFSWGKRRYDGPSGGGDGGGGGGHWFWLSVHRLQRAVDRVMRRLGWARSRRNSGGRVVTSRPRASPIGPLRTSKNLRGVGGVGASAGTSGSARHAAPHAAASAASRTM